MASILPFIKPEDGSFNDETTRNMGEAFNATITVLRSTAQPAIVYASVAASIIEAAGARRMRPYALARSRFDGTRTPYLGRTGLRLPARKPPGVGLRLWPMCHVSGWQIIPSRC